MIEASFPSPSQGVWEIGPFPLRAYALCIIAGAIVAVIMTERRWVARGGQPGTVADVAVWAVPAGIIGARVYHVVTSYELYEDRPFTDTLKVWNGGLGIWGAVAGGALGAWLYTRRHGIELLPFGDALAPGVAVAQAIGRLGNYFNQELFGRPTDVPWALEIDPENRPDGFEDAATFHPTFAYELLWNLGVAALVIWADRRFQLGRGRAFALYIAAYCAGRLWIEALRIDTANEILGIRLNVFTALVIFLLATAYVLLRRGPRETHVQEWQPQPQAEPQSQPDVPDAEPVGSPQEGEPRSAQQGPPDPETG